MTKSETRIDFEPLGNHKYVKRKINSKKIEISERKKSCISFSIIPPCIDLRNVILLLSYCFYCEKLYYKLLIHNFEQVMSS